MNEQDRAPLIQVSIDQEVYIDTVHATDKVEDATVATEVISFERMDETYVLEGAVIFAGYLSREESKADEEDAATSLLEEANTDTVTHVHHRLPFILRVSLRGQPRGIVNVKSRLSNWQLSVSGNGWLRVQGELQVAGLSGESGYYLQCGAQEFGQLHEEQEETQTSLVTEEETIPLVSAEMRSSPQMEDTTMDDNADGEERSFARMNEIQQQTESMSQARGGQEWASSANQTLEHPVEFSAEAKSKEFRAADELANLDRFIPELRNTPSDDAALLPEEDTQNLYAEHHSSSSAKDAKSVIAQFDFENQLSPEEILENEQEEKNKSTSKVGRSGPEISFSASRSFTDEGFHAGSGFIAMEPSASVPLSEAEETEVRAEMTSMEPMTSHESQNTAQTFSDPLWSFVDFNAPEKKYTLRYVIVMEEETLETVAERIGCTMTELMRVNRMTVETVSPGQTLRVPEVSFTLALR